MSHEQVSCPREASGVRPACWRCRKTGGDPKAGASSELSKRFAPYWTSSRFSNSARTGTRASLNTEAPLTLPGTRSTTTP